MAEDQGRDERGEDERELEAEAEGSDHLTEPDAPPPVLQYFGPTVKRTDSSGEITGRRTGDPLRLVTLITVDVMEAQLARAKLEAEGVPAFVIDQHASVVHPLLFRNAQLQVAERDVERAKKILDRPAAIDPEDQDGDGGYAEEDFRCPRCHRKAVELVPLTRTAKFTRAGCVVVLLLPAIPALLGWTALDARSEERIDQLFSEWRWLWLLLLM
jgi:hypothetical protein